MFLAIALAVIPEELQGCAVQTSQDRELDEVHAPLPAFNLGDERLRLTQPTAGLALCQMRGLAGSPEL